MPLKAIPSESYLRWEKHIPHGAKVERDTLITALCRGKTVLHVGAADSPFHVDKAKQGTLLHQRVRAVAKSVTGVDADKEAVEWLRRWHGIDDILVSDVAAGPVDGRNKEATDSYDVILCCDILEHAGNLDGVLQFCRAHMREGTTLVVTTINATSAKAAVRALLCREAVHPDHICYFSYGTLCMLLHKNGYQPREFGTFAYPTVSTFARLLFGIVSSIAPATGDGLLITASLRQR